MKIDELVEARRKSEKFKYFVYGENYYVARNDYIRNRKKEVFLEGVGPITNPFQANYKSASSIFKKIVDQKVSYLLGNGVNFIDEKLRDDIDNYFEYTFDDFIEEIGIEASKKAEAWVYAFREDNKLKFTSIPSEQCTPIYDERNRLAGMIRQYIVGDKTVRLVFDKEKITRYEKRSDEKEYKQIGVYGHYSDISYFNGEKVDEEYHSFGRVPFIPLLNNREMISDLYRIKNDIDIYDCTKSDFANNVDDFQEAFITFKGYTGDMKHAEKLLRQIKQAKTIPISKDGAVDIKQLEIPTNARETLLDRLKKDIYQDAMAVDTSILSGGSITNVVIQAMFADLDLKADQFENEVVKFLYKLVEFINGVDSKQYDHTAKFDRSLIMNRTEEAETILKMQGTTISSQTTRELLPYEIDEEQEKERLKEEQGEITLNSDINLEDIEE